MKKISIIALAVAASVAGTTALANDFKTQKAKTYNEKTTKETSMMMEKQNSECGKHNYYVRLGGGYGFIPGNTKLDIYIEDGTANASTPNRPSTPLHSGLKLSKGGNGGFIAPAVGMHINDNIRADLEMHWYYPQWVKHNETHKLTHNVADDHTATATTILKRESWSVMANAFYDFKIDGSKFVPFVGAGIGYGQTKFMVADLNYTVANSTAGQAATIVVDDASLTESATKKTKSSFIYGGTLGVGYQLCCNTRIEFAYTLQTLAKAETKLADKINVPAGSNGKKVITGQFRANNLMHAVRMGVLISF